MDILGVRIDNLSRKEILEKVEFFLNRQKFHQIATINPEFVLQAQVDFDFEKILNGCALNVADGIGIKFAFWRYGKQLKRRIAGADLMHDVLRVADRRRLKVFLAASAHGLSTWQETATVLGVLYPDVEFSGDNIDPLDFTYNLKRKDYDLLLCGFGAPHQERFINSVKNDTIRLAMGVGGSFDFVTGKISRAPKLWRKIGLEWLWRFIQEPGYRAKRIFNAIIVFPIKIIFKKNERSY
jgi:N-acetylglucosaminyldiphosphoundecaprenol N-acetyl-beta-D-mannosaminyltransferase